MPLYEHVFLARQDISTQQVETLVQEFKTVLESNGGTVGKNEYWGVKTLSFRIKKNRKAHFQLINIEAPHAAVAEMERQMRLQSDILRFLTLRVDAHETEPSAMMRRSDDRDRRDDRGGRGDRDGGRGRDGGFRRDRPDRDNRDRDRDRPPREPRPEMAAEGRSEVAS